MPLLSIIIPTKDRYETLLPVTEAILSHVLEQDYEIVIHDNSTQNRTAPELELLSRDPRVKYFYRADRMSVVENTIAAIDRAAGDYLCFIGDDDFVAPYLIEEVRNLQASGLDCLIHPPAYYWWGSVDFFKSDRYRRKFALWLPKALARGVLSASRELDHVLRNGAVSYYRLPRFYHGIVSRRALQSILDRTGSYCPGSSPDLAFSLALALVIKSYLLCDRPVTVFGASRGSCGGLTAARKHHGRLEEQAHLPKSTIERWDVRLPRYWSEYTIYPQTAKEVFDAFGSTHELDFAALYASILINEPWLWSMTWPLAWRYFGSSIKRWSRFGLVATKRLAGRTYRWLQSVAGKRPYVLEDCRSIAECMVALDRKYGRLDTGSTSTLQKHVL